MTRLALWVACWSALGGCGLILDATAPPDAGRAEDGAEAGGRDAEVDGGSEGGRPDGGAEAGLDGALRDAGEADATSDASMPSCTADSQCDDGLACTEDLCFNKSCVHRPRHGRCSGGPVCDVVDGCVAPRQCVSDADCAGITASPCRRGRCDVFTGRCTVERAPAGYHVVQDADGDDVCACLVGSTVGDGSGGSRSCGPPAGSVCPVSVDAACVATYVTWGERQRCIAISAPAGTLCFDSTSGFCDLPGRCDGAGSCEDSGDVRRSCTPPSPGPGSPPAALCMEDVGCFCRNSDDCGASQIVEGACEAVVPGSCRGLRVVSGAMDSCEGNRCVLRIGAPSVEGCHLPGDTECDAREEVVCEWGGDPCAPGRLVRLVEEGRCDGSGGCVSSGGRRRRDEVGSCPPRLAEGALCAVEVTAWGACTPREGADVCDPTGRQVRRMLVKSCQSQSCEDLDVSRKTESRPCTLPSLPDECDG